MAYVRRGPVRRRPRRPRRKPALTVKAPAKRVRVARKSRVDQLARAVRKLKTAQFGLAQTQRQSYRSAQVDYDFYFDLRARFPVMWCNEAIAPANSIIYGCNSDAASLWSAVPYGSWVTQPFGLTTLNVNNAKFDLQLYRNLKASGTPGILPVQGTYLVKGVSYDIQIQAQDFNGFVECYMVTPTRHVTRQTNLERELPYSLPSFVDIVGGGNQKYSHASQFYKIQRKWRMYINTTTPVVPAANPDFTRNTNNLFYKHMYISMGRGKVIRAPDTPGTAPAAIEVPTLQQSWLLFSSSTDGQTATSYVHIRPQRCVYFRDSIGSK